MPAGGNGWNGIVMGSSQVTLACPHETCHILPMGKSRVCNKCQKRKRAALFEKNGRYPDGSVRLRSICKPCGGRNKLVRTDDRTCTACKKFKAADAFQGRQSACRSCMNERGYKYKRGPGRKAHNLRMAEYNRHRWNNDPEFRKRHLARCAVTQAVRRGALERPKRCPRCGRKTVIHGHHHKGYDKKHELDVVWLCARCHRKEDYSEV